MAIIDTPATAQFVAGLASDDLVDWPRIHDELAKVDPNRAAAYAKLLARGDENELRIAALEEDVRQLRRLLALLGGLLRDESSSATR